MWKVFKWITQGHRSVEVVSTETPVLSFILFSYHYITISCNLQNLVTIQNFTVPG